MRRFLLYLKRPKKIQQNKLNYIESVKAMQVKLLSLTEKDIPILDKLNEQILDFLYNLCATNELALKCVCDKELRKNNQSFDECGLISSEIDIYKVRVVEVVEKFSLTPIVSEQILNVDNEQVKSFCDPIEFKEKTLFAYVKLDDGRVLDCRLNHISDNVVNLLAELRNIVYPLENLENEIVDKLKFFKVSTLERSTVAYNFVDYVRMAKTLDKTSDQAFYLLEKTSKDEINNLVKSGGELVGKEHLVDIYTKFRDENQVELSCIF